MLRLDQPRLLWYDGSDRLLAEKIPYAVKYYEEKYRVTATDVLINPVQSRLEKTPSEIEGITVAKSKYVGADYMSIGFKDYDDFKGQSKGD